MILEIQEKIYEKLNEIKADPESFLSEVYDYHTLDSEGDPYVIFEPSDFNSNIQDNSSNLVDFWFDIYVLSSFTDKRKDALNKVVSCTDEIYKAFSSLDSFYELNISDIEVKSWNFGQIIGEDWKMIFSNIRLVIKLIRDV